MRGSLGHFLISSLSSYSHIQGLILCSRSSDSIKNINSSEQFYKLKPTKINQHRPKKITIISNWNYDRQSQILSNQSFILPTISSIYFHKSSIVDDVSKEAFILPVTSVLSRVPIVVGGKYECPLTMVEISADFWSGTVSPFFLWQVYLNSYHATLGYLCWLTSQTVALTWYCTHQTSKIWLHNHICARSVPEARVSICMFSVGGTVWGTLWIDSNLFS